MDVCTYLLDLPALRTGDPGDALAAGVLVGLQRGLQPRQHGGGGRRSVWVAPFAFRLNNLNCFLKKQVRKCFIMFIISVKLLQTKFHQMYFPCVSFCPYKPIDEKVKLFLQVMLFF